MRALDKKTYSKGVYLFLTTYSDFKIEKRAQEIYFDMLKYLTNMEFLSAIENIVSKTISIYPNTSFVALVKENVGGDKKLSALIAWELVIETIRKHSRYASISFEDTAIHRTIKLMGGWLDLCDMPIKEMKWKFKEFSDIYDVMNNGPLASGDQKHLPGLLEIANGGRQVEPMVVIAKVDETKLLT